MGVKKIKSKKKMNAKKLKYFSIFVPNLHVKNITHLLSIFLHDIWIVTDVIQVEGDIGVACCLRGTFW